MNLRYYVFTPLTSCFPEKVLRWLDHHMPIDRDVENFNWSFWTDAGYWKYVRRDMRINKWNWTKWDS